MWIDPSTKVQSMQPTCIPDPSLPGIANGGAYRATPVQHVPTIMNRLDAAGLSWHMYAADSTQPGNYVWATCPIFAECLYGPQHVNVVPTANILADAQKGTLPNFSLVLPGGGLASASSQHNGSSMIKGDNWIGKVVSAIENGPDWSSTAIFITYDDCGCFYDHVPPSTNPDGTRQGPRVPMVIVSPYAKAGFTDSTPATFASILAFEEYVFGLQALGANDAAAYRFTNAFDYSQIPLAKVLTVQSQVPLTPITQGDPDDPT
jgi:phospholipase C